LRPGTAPPPWRPRLDLARPIRISARSWLRVAAFGRRERAEHSCNRDGLRHRQDAAALAQSVEAIEAPSEELAERGKAIGEFFRRLDEAGASETDQAADRLRELGCRWNPLINAISTYINGVELDRLSVKDFWRYRDTGVNWRVAEGYGTLIAALGTGPNIVFDCAVTLIDFTSAVVRIETPRGDLCASAAIVTVPTNVLCSGSLRFQPDLPDKMEAAAARPCR
jgi:hypothetical protein